MSGMKDPSKYGPSRVKLMMLATVFAGIVLSLGRGPAVSGKRVERQVIFA